LYVRSANTTVIDGIYSALSGNREMNSNGGFMKHIVLFLCLGIPAAAQSGIVPFIDCMNLDTSNNQLTVFFGYVSSNSGNVTVAIGPNNYVSPAPMNRGETTVFSPGVNPDQWETSFDITETSSITWNLLGQTVTVSNDPTLYCSRCLCPQGPVGTQGPQGPPGPQGPALAPIQTVTAATTTATATASCPAGQILLSGGGACSVSQGNGRIASSLPSGASWIVSCDLGTATAVAICANPD
jgi:hypothetical protein